MQTKYFIALSNLFLIATQLPAQRQPNIVLIMADDMGYECLGCNGSTNYQTPNIDRIAKEGVRFENCYSQPLSTPSRVKIMTGKHNYRNYEDFGYLNPNQETFGNLLQNAGYATCIAGKWQLNGLNRNNPDNQDVERPYHFGFDEYCLWQLNHHKKEGERYSNPLIIQNGKKLERNPDAYGPRIFADYVMDFIDRKVGEPFFVYYPMVLVHDPFVPTPDSPEWADPKLRHKNDTAYFADMMAYTDKLVGEIETKLKEKGLWENTLFIFTADNGTNTNIVSSTRSGVIQGGKGETINYGNHVPFVLSWPTKMEKKRRVESLISFADVLPTICDIAGIHPEKYKTDGKSFYSLIANKNGKVQNEIFIHYSPRMWIWTELHNRWVLDGRYKLYQDGRFFNTIEDPLEISPLDKLSMKEQKIKNRFQKILEEKEKETPFELNNTEFKVENENGRI